MAEYYLISQLPSLDGLGENTPLPITQERFFELCKQFLSQKAKKILENLTLVPDISQDNTGSDLVNAWNEGERNLRLALAKIRADKMGKHFNSENKIIPTELLKVANTASEMESPLEAENFLNFHRLSFLETLRPMDSFSEDFVFYYGLKLMLVSRAKKFDMSIGEATYKNIYNSILGGDKLEATQ